MEDACTPSAGALKLAAVLIALTGLIHLVESPEYFEEQAYVGVLFVLNAIVSAGVAVVLWRRLHPGAWFLGALIAAGSILGFVLSRTTGIPGFYEPEWDEPLGIASLVVETGFLGVALSVLSAGRRTPAT